MVKKGLILASLFLICLVFLIILSTADKSETTFTGKAISFVKAFPELRFKVMVLVFFVFVFLAILKYLNLF